MTKLFNFKKSKNLENYIIIIPSVSIGNVPQLTVDLIISSYNLKKAATIWHPGIIPSVGGDPFGNNVEEICTACELFIREDLKLGVIQLRSGVDKKYASKFYEDLKGELLEMNVDSVVLLASSFAYEMHDIKSSKYRYVTNYLDEAIFEKQGILKLETMGNELILHGSGFAGKLYSCLTSDLKVNLITNFVSEGDNRPDAVMMLNVLQGLFSIINTNPTLLFPASWSYVFGNSPPIGIY